MGETPEQKAEREFQERMAEQKRLAQEAGEALGKLRDEQ